MRGKETSLCSQHIAPSASSHDMHPPPRVCGKRRHGVPSTSFQVLLRVI
jgi:hypothetical protein